MRRLVSLIVGIVLLAGVGTVAGCAVRSGFQPVVLGSPALLFDRHPVAVAATSIGRGDWPAATGPFESVEETTFEEFYHDHQGNAFQEDFTPHREFRSYRSGRQER